MDNTPNENATHQPMNLKTESSSENSRLQKNLQQKSIKNILFTIFGIIIFLAVLFALGPQLLITLSTLTTNTSDKNTATEQIEERTYIAPPMLNQTISATNSATTTISGSAEAKETVNLYINGSFVDKTTAKSDRSFIFKNVTLEKGENIIKAKTRINKQESSYSSPLTIVYSEKEPTLELESPQDGQTFKKDQSPITVKGKTDQGSKVTVNDFWAIVDDSGSFSYRYTLKDGENTIKIAVTNEVGNKISKEVKIKVE